MSSPSSSPRHTLPPPSLNIPSDTSTSIPSSSSSGSGSDGAANVSPKSPARAASLNQPTTPQSVNRGRLSDLPARRGSAGTSRAASAAAHAVITGNTTVAGTAAGSSVSPPPPIASASSSTMSDATAALNGTVAWSALIASTKPSTPANGSSAPSSRPTTEATTYHNMNNNHTHTYNNSNGNGASHMTNGSNVPPLNFHGASNNQWTNGATASRRNHNRNKSSCGSYGGNGGQTAPMPERKLHPGDDQAARKVASALNSVRNHRRNDSHAASGSFAPSNNMMMFPPPSSLSLAPMTLAAPQGQHRSQPSTSMTASIMIRAAPPPLRPQVKQIRRQFDFCRWFGAQLICAGLFILSDLYSILTVDNSQFTVDALTATGWILQILTLILLATMMIVTFCRRSPFSSFVVSSCLWTLTLAGLGASARTQTLGATKFLVFPSSLPIVTALQLQWLAIVALLILFAVLFYQSPFRNYDPALLEVKSFTIAQLQKKLRQAQAQASSAGMIDVSQVAATPRRSPRTTNASQLGTRRKKRSQSNVPVY